MTCGELSVLRCDASYSNRSPLLDACIVLVSFVFHTSVVKIEAKYYCETEIHFRRNRGCYVAKVKSPRQHRYEYPKL
jgi:hypothetical protein